MAVQTRSSRRRGAAAAGDSDEETVPFVSKRKYSEFREEGAPFPAASRSRACGYSSFLLRPHSITLLLAMLSFFLLSVYYPVFGALDGPGAQIKAGLCGVFVVLVVLSLHLLPDGPFVRPHPALWRAVLGIGVSYLLFLVFLLFQDPSAMRSIVHSYDPGALGTRLPEKQYAVDCSLSWGALVHHFDIFVACHVVGWFVKALIFRDAWMCWIISVMFEVMEYSLEFQLPNFAECWWDHWVLDVLLCNALGIVLGLAVVRAFSIKRFDWQGWRFLPLSSSLLPYKWWWPGGAFSLRSYLAVVFVVGAALVTELNCFYLKHLLWIPTSHFLNLYRILLVSVLALGATREFYDFVHGGRAEGGEKTLGPFAWIALAVVSTESIVCLKLARGQFPNSPPERVVLGWLVGLALLLLFPVWKMLRARAN